MDQHPVPQNITSFQFKLIGDMTIKQFGYLAGGIIGGYLTTLLPWADIFKWPLAITLGFLGFAFAFVPIEERPLDRWLKAFINAIYAPTQFIWKKTPVVLDFLSITSTPKVQTDVPKENLKKPETKLKEFLKTLPAGEKKPIDEKEISLLQKLDFSIGGNITILPTQNISQSASEDTALPQVRIHKLKNAPISGEIVFPIGDKKLMEKEVILEEPKPPSFPSSPFTNNQYVVTAPVRQISEEEIKPSFKPKILDSFKKNKTTAEEKVISVKAKEEINSLRSENDSLNEQIKEFRENIEKLQNLDVQNTEGKQRLKEMLEKYEDALRQKERSINEIVSLRKQNEEIQKQSVVPGIKTQKSTPRVQFVAAESAKSQGLPSITQTPNVVTGIVTDQKGGVLTGVILTIKDKQGNPVRAIKTNAVGQFKTGTPLSNGEYSIELEKENYNFDIISLEVKGDVLSPLEIKAK